MIINSRANPEQARRDAERQDTIEQELAAKPIQEKAAILAKEWQVTPHFALRFLQLEQQVAELKSK